MAISQCHECIEKTQHKCKMCRGGYCITHNEGSTTTFVSLDKAYPGQMTSQETANEISQCDCMCEAPSLCYVLGRKTPNLYANDTQGASLEAGA